MPRVLDVGCGWGALLDRFVRRARRRRRRRSHAEPGPGSVTPPAAPCRGVDFRLESWVDHEPTEPYDVVTCIESTEHFASDALDADEKVEVYRAFFDRAASWLRRRRPASACS